MPDDRLVLPLADLDASAVGPGAVADPAGSVVLVVPSLVRLLQAAWLASLRRRPWATFEDWLTSELADEAGTGPEWRYDRVVAAWAEAVGAERVQLVVGDDRTPEPATRSLTGAEVATVEALVAELEDLGLTGRNAVDLLQGAVATVLHGPADPHAVPGHGVRLELSARTAATAETMLANVEAAGVAVAGDRSALLWPTAGPEQGEGLVGLSAAVDLSIGALERVASWAGSGSRA